jgi:hypothetical protein
MTPDTGAKAAYALFDGNSTNLAEDHGRDAGAAVAAPPAVTRIG